MNKHTVKATIIFEGDREVGQQDEVYQMELPYTQKEWEEITLQEKLNIKRHLKQLYNYLHNDRVCRIVRLPEEKS